MELTEIRRRLDDERRSLARTGEVLDLLPEVTRVRNDSLYMVSWSALNNANADSVITREIAYHAGFGVPFEWKLYSHDTPGDLVQRLERHGLVIGPREAVMVYDLSDVPDWLQESAQTRVVRLNSTDQVAGFRRVAEEVFHKDYTWTTEQLKAAISAGAMGHLGYIAYVGEEPASIGRLYTDPNSLFAGLYGGGTLARFRGRGLYRAVVAARAHDAIQLGSRYLLVDALPTSRPILERLGFQHLSDTWPCEWHPPIEPAL